MFLSLFPMIHFIVLRILSILKTKTKNIEIFLYSPILERGFYVNPWEETCKINEGTTMLSKYKE
jgi:hypothetical protein